jgi:hypothetical protein
MRYTKSGIIAYILLAITVAGISACETNDVTSDWDAVYDSNPSEKTYDSLYKMSVDSKGDIILIGSSSLTKVVPLDERLVVVKYSKSGTKVWDFIHEFSYRQGIYISDYCIDNENNIYVSGVTNNESAVFLIKLSSSGAFLWETIVERDGWLTGAVTCINGTVYWAHMDLTLVDALTGVIITTTAVNNRMTDMVYDSAGNIYVAGYDFYASYDTAGSLRWTKPWDTSLQAVTLSIGTGDNLYASAGVASSSYTVTVLKISTSGNITGRVNENISNAWNPQFSTDKSGNVIIAASKEGSLTRTVIKYNSNLVKTWTKNFEASKLHSDLDQMIVDNSGNIYITGGDITTKISASGSRIVSEKDASYYSGNRIALSPDNTKMYIGTSADSGEITLLLSQYSNR